MGEIVKEPDHKFWNTQPVPQDDVNAVEGPIDAIKKPEDIRDTPFKLPASFVWCDIDINNDKEVEEVYDLLLENYVEDDGAQFRFAYSKEFLKWALCPPGYKKEYHIGVKNAKSGELFGFVSAIPQLIRVKEKSVPMVDVNFLCVHKKIRSKRLAPVLIKEVTRRVNRNDGWQAIYTAGTVIPTPITTATYYHRSLNVKKLVDIGFTHVPRRITAASYYRFMKVPTEFSLPGIRQTKEEDIPAIYGLYTEYMKQFMVYPELSLEEIRHFIMPREGIINSFVVEDPETKKITDFISYFLITSSVMGNKDYNSFTAVYAYYYAATSTPLKDLFSNALVGAAKDGGDVFNALEVMNNASVFEELKFGKGDGDLHYYFYNWKLNHIEPSKMGVILP